MSKKDEELKEDDVTLSRGELNALLDRIKKLENPGMQKITKRTKDHVGHLREWDGGVVIRVGNAHENFQVSSESPERISIDITVATADGKEKELSVSYLEFLTNAKKVPVKLKKIERNERLATELEEGGGGWGNKAASISIDGIGSGISTDSTTLEQIPLSVGYVDVSIEAEVSQGPMAGKTFKFGPAELTAINA